MTSSISTIDAFPSRTLIRRRFQRLISSSSLIPPSIYFFGLMGSGKAQLLEETFYELAQEESSNLLIGSTSCVQSFWPKLLFRDLLQGLGRGAAGGGHGGGPEAGRRRESPDGVGGACKTKCESLSDFVSALRRLELPAGDAKIVLLLHAAERLRDADANLLPGFIRLQELTGLNLCTVLVSSLAWHKFAQFSAALSEPIIIHCPQLTSDEVAQLIASSLSSSEPDGDKYSHDFHRGYANIVVRLFQTASRSVDELKRIAKMHVDKYKEPVEKGETRADNLRSLYRNIEPLLRQSLASVHLREAESEQWRRAQRRAAQDRGDDAAGAEAAPASGKAAACSRQHVELPYYSKFLLIAAYLASYNPAKTDKRFFMKHHGKERKTKALIRAKARSSSQLLGPKPFPLDRMMAIFYAVAADDKIAPTANILSQISSLATLQFLTPIGGAGGDRLDAPKYKCSVGLEFIKNVARTVNFDIMRYLYDFA